MAPKKKPTGIAATLVRIYEESNYRTAKNIDDWRSAITLAEDLISPTYLPLYNLYREIELDAHITGLIMQRNNRLLGSQFRIVDEQGNEDVEATRLFERSWFYKFLEFAMDARWWGHSLVQLWDVNENGYGTVELVNRNHIVPSKHVLTPRQQMLVDAIDYRQPEYYDNLIEVGDGKDLGLFNKAAPNFLIKKNALKEWSKYAQIFGFPLVLGTTMSKSQADLERMATNLRKMQSAAYAALQQGEEVKVVETSKTDAYKVFQELILTPNNELSKLFLGQTMTTDNGSSRSQSEVHERVADSIADADKRSIAFLVNDELIPRMIKHGFTVLNKRRFEFAAVKDLAGQMELVKALMPYKNVDNKYITETFGIPVEDKADTTAAIDPAGAAKPEKKKLSLKLMAELERCYAGACNHVHLSTGKGPDGIDVDALAKFIYDNQDAQGVIHPDTYLETARQLVQGFSSGYGSGFTEDGIAEIRAKIQQNVYPFSAAKTLTQMEEMRGMLFKDGKLLSYSEFRRGIENTGIKFNATWLNAEYNLAVASGQSAMRWDEAQSNSATYPNVTYRTAGDERVRESHARLDGLTFSLADPILKTIWPPNDWGCRCDMESSDAPVSNVKVNANIVPPLFRNNVGLTQVVYKDNHPYYKGNKGVLKNLSFENYNLKPLADIVRTKLAPAETPLAAKTAYNDWAKKALAGNDAFTLKTFDAPVTITRETVKQVGAAEGGWPVTPNLAELLQNPSEAYQYKEGKNLHRTFIKHFSDKSIIATAELKDKAWTLTDWFEADMQSGDELRIGALLHKQK